MIKRALQTVIEKNLFSGKTILLVGARQVGKTTLLKTISKPSSDSTIWLNGDNPDDRTLLNEINSTKAKALFPPQSMVIIDEAQRIENAGLTLKIIHDNCNEIQLIATGSSSFELTDKIKESMTGRKWTYKLYPISLSELIAHSNPLEVFRATETRMIYGSYPDVINHQGNETPILQELITDYLYRDVFAFKDVRKPEVLEKLIKALSFQIGNQVSNRELANLIQIDKNTVDRYLYLLEEAYIIFRLTSFSRNLRTELKRSKKIYFYDLGIRNAVINQFSPLSLRNDTGALWENFMIVERLKKLDYNKVYRNTYFWRTTRQQEIDYLEEKNGKLYAYEFKWNQRKKVRLPASFNTSYPNTELQVITKDNFLPFIS